MERDLPIWRWLEISSTRQWSVILVVEEPVQHTFSLVQSVAAAHTAVSNRVGLSSIARCGPRRGRGKTRIMNATV